MGPYTSKHRNGMKYRVTRVLHLRYAPFKIMVSVSERPKPSKTPQGSGTNRRVFRVTSCLLCVINTRKGFKTPLIRVPFKHCLWKMLSRKYVERPDLVSRIMLIVIQSFGLRVELCLWNTHTIMFYEWLVPVQFLATHVSALTRYFR